MFAWAQVTGCSVDADSGIFGDSEWGGSNGGADSTGGTTGPEAPPPVVCEENAGVFDAVLDWSDAANTGISSNFVAVHAIHAPPVGGPKLDRDPTTARVFMMGGYVDQHLWDPLTGDFYTDGTLLFDDATLFCSGHAITPQGNLFFAGGGGGNAGLAIDGAYSLFRENVSTGIWTAEDPMQYERWYPTVISLADGRILVFGGGIDPICADIDEQSPCEALPSCNWEVNACAPDVDYISIARQTPEVFDYSMPEGSRWTSLARADFRPPLYPFMFLLPDGNVFYAGGDPGSGDQDADVDMIGRVLVFNGPSTEWGPHLYDAGLAGGSAVIPRVA